VLRQGKQLGQRFDPSMQAATTKDVAFHPVLDGKRCCSWHRAHQDGKLGRFEAPGECSSVWNDVIVLWLEEVKWVNQIEE